MQVPYDEGVAIHIGPESRAVAREGLGEALTGVRVGQPLSRESFLFWVPTPCIRGITWPETFQPCFSRGSQTIYIVLLETGRAGARGGTTREHGVTRSPC